MAVVIDQANIGSAYTFSSMADAAPEYISKAFARWRGELGSPLEKAMFSPTL